MAKLPIIQTSGGVTPSVQGARINARQIQAAGDEQFQGLMKFADGAFEVAERLKVARDAADGMSAASEFSRELDVYRTELDKDGDYATKAQRFQDFAQAKLTERIKGLDRRAADILVARLTPVAQAMEQTVRAGSRRDEIQDGVTKIRSANDELLGQAHAARSDVERDAYLAQIKSNIDTGLQTGLLTAATHKEEMKNTLGKADQAYVLRLIGQNPGAAQALLADPKRMTNLDPVQRERLIDAARDEGRKNAALAIQFADREERRQDRVLRRAGDEADKAIARMEADGTLTREAVDAMRPYLSANDYRAALRSVTGGAAVDDRKTLIEIEPELHRQDMSDKIKDAYANKQLTTATYRSMLERNAAALKDDQPHSTYRTSREYIASTLDPGPMAQGPSSVPLRWARANALREFDNWSRANPNARPEDVQAEASRTVDRFVLVNFNEMSQSLGLPRYADPGVTRQTISIGDIDKAERAAIGAYQQKELDRAGYDDELRKLRSWRTILEKRAPMAPPTSTAPPAAPQPGRR